MDEMHSLNGHLAIASLIQDPLRLISGPRDTILFMSSFKQGGGQSWATVSAPCMPTLISVPGGKSHREGHGLPGTPCELVAGQGGVHSRQRLLSPYLHSSRVLWAPFCWYIGN